MFFKLQFARIHTSSLIKIEKILNRPITKFYNSDDVNAIAAELRLTKTRPTSLAHLKSGTRDLDPPPGTLLLGPRTWGPGPYMRDPIWNQDQISLRGTQGPYINTNLGTLILIQLSLNVRFSSAA